MTFADHFSDRAEGYAQFRPSYPEALGQFLADRAGGREFVWDCATGSGQAARLLVSHFDHVWATDASEVQIAHAPRHDRIAYRVADASCSGLPDRSCDLVTVAQAAHWLPLTDFYAEAARVLKPNALIALWCYEVARSDYPKLDDVIRRFQCDRLAVHWPPGRELVNNQYRTLPFPFTPIDVPSFELSVRWTRTQLVGYVRTWSAVGRCRAAEGIDPMVQFEAAIDGCWPDVETVALHWPLHLRAGRLPTE